MSPARTVTDTSARARRRPKWRETSRRLTASKSSGTSGGDISVVVERAVDVFESRDQLFAARAVTACVRASAAMIAFEPDEIREQLLAPRNQALALGRAAGGIHVVARRRGPHA